MIFARVKKNSQGDFGNRMPPIAGPTPCIPPTFAYRVCTFKVLKA